MNSPGACRFLVATVLWTMLLLHGLSSYVGAQAPVHASLEEYKIGPKDLLEIRVFGLDELNSTVRVSQSGSITLPLLGEVVVAGMTKQILESRLSAMLEEKYLKNAQVTVFIKEYQSQRVAVIGAVKNPGTYELLGRQTVLQMISQAGGLTDLAGGELFILRESKSGLSAHLDINLDELMIEGNPRLNVPLYPNDVMNIPIDRIIHIYVFGEVTKPGALEVRKSKKLTLLQAIAQAGGTTDRASKSKVTVKKIDKSGHEVKFTVNIDDILQGKKPDIPMDDGYVVYVPESLF